MKIELSKDCEIIKGVHKCEFRLPNVPYIFRVLQAYILPNHAGIFFYEIIEGEKFRKFRGQYRTCGRIPWNKKEALELIAATYERWLAPIED